MNRLNQILVILLVLQLAVTAVVLWPRPADTGEAQSLFSDIETDQIVGLTITGSEGQSVELARQGDQWVLPAADDYPVQEGKVPSLLEKLVALKADRLVTQTSGSHNRLKVADGAYERLVEFELEEGTRHRLYVGTSPTYGVTHIRAEGQDQVYLTSELSTQDAGAEASTWVDRNYLEIPRDQIVRLTLENESGQFEFEREGESWTMVGLAEDETLDETSVTGLVGRAALVSLLRPLGKEEKAEYGLDAPRAVVHIQTKGEGATTYTLWVGAQDPGDKSYVIRSSESGYYVRVSEYAVRDFVENTRDDFLELPPTPTAESTSESP